MQNYLLSATYSICLVHVFFSRLLMIYVSYIPFNRRKAVGWILAAESGQQFVERNQITIRSAEFFVVIWLDYMPEASWDVEAEIFI